MKSYGNIFLKSPLGYALHKIIVNESGKPLDYEFIDVNESFEKLTGLKKNNVIGKTVKEVIPGIDKSEFDWINFYGKVALEDTEEIFEQFSEPLKKHSGCRIFTNILNPSKRYTCFQNHVCITAKVDF